MDFVDGRNLVGKAGAAAVFYSFYRNDRRKTVEIQGKRRDFSTIGRFRQKAAFEKSGRKGKNTAEKPRKNLSGIIFGQPLFFRQNTRAKGATIKPINRKRGMDMQTNLFGTLHCGGCRCTLSCQDGLLSARLSGEIDQAGAAGLREKIDRAADSCLPETLMLDFTGVNFMDSSGIGLIMGRYRLMQTMGGELLVTGASPRLRRMMQLGGLEQLPIFGCKPQRAKGNEPT
jgi:stage II sporulation protein AA (anti-sigma F factor antagonist)